MQLTSPNVAKSVWRFQYGARGDPGHDSGSAKNSPVHRHISSTTAQTWLSFLPISLGPGEMMHLRLRIDHQHILYGDYDPLLGVRTIKTNP